MRLLHWHKVHSNSNFFLVVNEDCKRTSKNNNKNPTFSSRRGEKKARERGVLVSPDDLKTLGKVWW